jgi:hypothetical protein
MTYSSYTSSSSKHPTFHCFSKYCKGNDIINTIVEFKKSEKDILSLFCPIIPVLMEKLNKASRNVGLCKTVLVAGVKPGTLKHGSRILATNRRSSAER